MIKFLLRLFQWELLLLWLLKKIILVCYGDKKADAIFKMVKGPVTEEVPASVLQNHPDVTLILDEQLLRNCNAIFEKQS